mgnify:FL=1
MKYFVTKMCIDDLIYIPSCEKIKSFHTRRVYNSIWSTKIDQATVKHSQCEFFFGQRERQSRIRCVPQPNALGVSVLALEGSSITPRFVCLSAISLLHLCAKAPAILFFFKFLIAFYSSIAKVLFFAPCCLRVNSYLSDFIFTRSTDIIISLVNVLRRILTSHSENHYTIIIFLHCFVREVLYYGRKDDVAYGTEEEKGG